jgi:putative cardiolipin synthase
VADAPRAPLARLRQILAALLRRAPRAVVASERPTLEPGASTLARALADLTASGPPQGGGAEQRGRSGFALLDDGAIAFLLRAALADRAEQRIDVQYYAYLADAAGTLLMHRLLAAADRGVRVRILLDDSGLGWRDRALAELDAHPCIDLKLFNPSSERSRLWRLVEFLLNMRRLNRRMHNKMFVVDGAVAIVGGRNVSDRYFAGRTRASFRDYDVAALGPAAAEAAASFERFWSSPHAVPTSRLIRLRSAPAALARRRETLARQVARLVPDQAARSASAEEQLSAWLSGTALHWARGEVIAEDPERVSGAGGNVIADRLTEVLARAEHEVLIESAYFVPGAEGVALFAAAVRRGVRVRILTNALAATDVPVVHAGYAPYRAALLDAGVELHEFRRRPRGRRWVPRRLAVATEETVLHAKVLVVDRRIAWVGSFNVDPRSVAINTEAGVLIESPGLAEELALHIEADLGPEHAWRLARAGQGLVWRGQRQGRPLEFHHEPEASLWRRVRVALFGLVPGSEGLL